MAGQKPVTLVRYVQSDRVPMTITVSLGERSYPIWIIHKGLQRVGELLTEIGLTEKVLIVSNPLIFRYYGEELSTALKTAGFDVQFCLLPAGERYKTLKTVERIYDHCAQHRLERRSTLIALVVGSLVIWRDLLLRLGYGDSFCANSHKFVGDGRCSHWP